MSYRLSKQPDRLMISFRCGRLGNRLILFANFIAFAQENGIRVGNPTFQTYADSFEGTRQNFWCQFPPPPKSRWASWVTKPFRMLRLMHHLVRYGALANEKLKPFDRIRTVHEIADERFTDLESGEFKERLSGASFVFIYGWLFRAPSLVEQHAATIREFFTPLPRFMSEADRTLVEIQSTAEILIGVHMRRGDYRHWCGGQFYFEAQEYAHWMRQAQGLFPGQTVGFFICSDEEINLSEFQGLLVCSGQGNPISDIYALSRCKYIMGPRSTFTQWAAFYGDVPLMHLESKEATVELHKFRPCYLDWPC